MMKSCVSLLLAGFCLTAQAQLPNAPSAERSTASGAPIHASVAVADGAANNDNYTPLTTAAKFQLAAKSSFQPLVFPEVALIAGISQGINTHSAWGQGGEGYAKRYGAAFADQAIGNMLSEAVFPSMFKQDPRYFRKGSGTTGSRFGYSLSRLWFTRNDNGMRAPNYSAILGAGAASGISLAYYPENERTAGNAMATFGVLLATDVAWNEFHEFWPDVRRALRHK